MGSTKVSMYSDYGCGWVQTKVGSWHMVIMYILSSDYVYKYMCKLNTDKGCGWGRTKDGMGSD